MPTVNVVHFDGPRVTVVKSPIASGPSTTNAISKDGGDAHDIAQDGQMIEIAELPHGRMHTGVVITQSKDQATYDGTGNRSTFEEPMPGVGQTILLDAVGAPTPFLRDNAINVVMLPWITPCATHDWQGTNELCLVCTQQGGGGQPEDDVPEPVDAGVPPPESLSGADIDTQPESTFNCDTGGHCCARGIDVSYCGITSATVNRATGSVEDDIGGNGRDPYNGVYWSVGPIGKSGSAHLMGDWVGPETGTGENEVEYVRTVGGKFVKFLSQNGKRYRVLTSGKDESGKPVDYFPDPNKTSVKLIDGSVVEYDPEDYAVPKAVYDRYKKLSPGCGGIPVPQGVYDALMTAGEYVLFVDEIFLLTTLYAYGHLSDEVYRQAASLIAGYTLGFVASSAGGPVVAAGVAV